MTTTLRHALVAAIVLVAAVVLARNLPALLEITVLSRLPWTEEDGTPSR